jgi:cell division transport system permease protein
MTLKSHLIRAQRGVREEAKLYVIAVSSLTVAFLSLAAALLALTNLASLADRWGRTHRMSIYLTEGAAIEDVDRLRSVLSGLPAVQTVELVSAEQARADFLRDTQHDAALDELPAEVFPASVEVEFAPSVSEQRIEEVAGKVRVYAAAVDQVDTYKSWFTQLASLVSVGRSAALGLGGLVVLCVFAVVSNTIRLAIANRRDEIELLRMCGATDSFVRGPFVLEGGIQGFASAGMSVLLLAAVHFSLRGKLDAALAPIAGVHVAFLPPAVMAALVLGGGLLGAVGGALAIRRYMTV